MFKTILKSVQTPLLVALVTSVLVNGLCYFAASKPHIATVDILSITKLFIREEAKKNHLPEEKEIEIKVFSHELESALQRLTHSKKCILLPREAVIKGSPDYTDTLVSMMNLAAKS